MSFEKVRKRTLDDVFVCVIWFFTSQLTIFQLRRDLTQTHHTEAGEAWTRNPSVSSQALYHWATGSLSRQCERLLCMQIVKFVAC